MTAIAIEALDANAKARNIANIESDGPEPVTGAGKNENPGGRVEIRETPGASQWDPRAAAPAEGTWVPEEIAGIETMGKDPEKSGEAEEVVEDNDPTNDEKDGTSVGGRGEARREEAVDSQPNARSGLDDRHRPNGLVPGTSPTCGRVGEQQRGEEAASSSHGTATSFKPRTSEAGGEDKT